MTGLETFFIALGANLLGSAIVAGVFGIAFLVERTRRARRQGH
ncbi:Hypothetical protein NGAL_HAMBI2605_59450 [Neorhizobium galegae bv. orientalis]|nr:Hypothetical protein NGAL_HAMBI2605_59450 [Neorhizobium galegae bv. orientalis]